MSIDFRFPVRMSTGLTSAVSGIWLWKLRCEMICPCLSMAVAVSP